MDAKYLSLSFYEFAWMGAELTWHSSDLLTAGMEYNDLMGVSIAWLLLFAIFCKKFCHQHAVIKSTISIPSYFYFLNFANGIRLLGNDNTCIIHDNTGIGPPRNRQR